MNKRQTKKHWKKAIKLSIISIDLAERYLKRYNVKDRKWKHNERTY